MKLVENARKECAKKGITVTELERSAGLTDNAIYKWDRHKPSVDKVKRAADVLQTTVDELIR